MARQVVHQLDHRLLHIARRLPRSNGSAISTGPSWGPAGQGRADARAAARSPRAGLAGTAATVRSADAPLKAAGEGVIATSDSAIIDGASVPVFDLGHAVLREKYGLEPYRLLRRFAK